MEKYYFVVILGAMTSALDIPSEHNAITAKCKLLAYRENIPTKDSRTKNYINRYIELIDALLIALEKDCDEGYDCVRSGMYAIISEFAKCISDEIESVYF